MSFLDDAEAMRAAIALTPGWNSIPDRPDPDALTSVLNEASKLAETVIEPVDAAGDRIGARFDAGRVSVPAGYRPAFDALAAGGWLGLEQDAELGGMGLPISLFVAVNSLFDRASPALMMAADSTRAAALLLAEWAEPEVRDDWVPALASGERCATICISEPGAGSDLGRIRTRAIPDTRGGAWSVSGQKIWISFGDHDLRARIGHCLLARSNDQPGTRGLSLFLVERGPGVACERIEEKLGLHGSPTCALHFDGAKAVLIGEEGRGLAQLFTMIRHMRLSVACQGLGVALRCHDVALAHSEMRHQGGDPRLPPVPISQHPDVARQLLSMKSAIDLFRLALLETAVSADLARRDPDRAALCALLLPLVKTFGAELGFDAASKAILVLGGSGYTRDYPLERSLRDARVFAVYEGTTGMQALDFTLRQALSPNGRALELFLATAREDCAAHPAQAAVIEDFAALCVALRGPDGQGALPWGADATMRAGWIAVQAWLSTRIADSIEARYFMLTARTRLATHAEMAIGGARL